MLPSGKVVRTQTKGVGRSIYKASHFLGNNIIGYEKVISIPFRKCFTAYLALAIVKL